MKIKYISYLLASCVILSSSQAFAMEGQKEEDIGGVVRVTSPQPLEAQPDQVLATNIDKGFLGEELIVGGLTHTHDHPKRLSINPIPNVDINGSGWDLSLIQRLTPDKYTRVLFERIGLDLGTIMPGKKGENASIPRGRVELAKAYYNALKSGGAFEFKSLACFFTYSSERDCIWRHMGKIRFHSLPPFKFVKEPRGLVLPYKKDNSLYLTEEKYAQHFEELVNDFYQDKHVFSLVNTLSSAGFEDITVSVDEKYDSLHVIAKKP
ncbi:MAG: hypothetical protein BGO67_04645 [Alphaproteobacteria bacterium 41-28]|nr:MAG: hypothetical protein BGO67_04645 [Alphaproteobacteria bacterium 41-28]